MQRHALHRESCHQVPSFQVTSELCSLPFLGLYLECRLWNPLFGGPSRRLLLSKCFLPHPHVQILTDLFHTLIIPFLYYSLHLQAFFLFFPCYFLMTISVVLGRRIRNTHVQSLYQKPLAFLLKTHTHTQLLRIDGLVVVSSNFRS